MVDESVFREELRNLKGLIRNDPAIAARYDLMNVLMTFGQDRVWRRCVIRAAGIPGSGIVLDAGTGSGGIALEDGDPAVRRTAVEKLSDQALLARIALEDTDWYVCRAAVEQLTDQALLAKVSRAARYSAVRRAAAGRSGRRARPAASRPGRAGGQQGRAGLLCFLRRL